MMRFNKRLMLAWSALTALTLSYLWIDRSAGFHASALVTVTAIVIAVIKVRVIFREFMEVRHAPALLCRLTDAWVVLFTVALLGSYFAGAVLQT